MNKEILENYLKQHPFVSLNKAVFNILYNAIIQNELPVGSKLNMAQLAIDMDVSRSPIQEACKELEDIHFLESFTDKKGYYVSKFKTADLNNICSARKMFESTAAFYCVKYHYFEYLNEMENLAEKFKDAILIKNYDIISDLDISFHKLLIKSSHNPYIIKSYNGLLKIWLRFSLSINKSFEINPENPYINAAAYEHINICKAINTGIPQMAEDAVISHLETVLISTLSQKTEWTPL